MSEIGNDSDDDDECDNEARVDIASYERGVQPRRRETCLTLLLASCKPPLKLRQRAAPLASPHLK